MSLLSLIAVFLIEQLQPLSYRRMVANPVSAWADFIETRFNDGEYRHGVIAWCLAALLPVGLLAVLYYVLYAFSPLLAWGLNVAALYLTMGFRQFSHHYTEIQLALRQGDLPQARAVLGEWQGRSAEGLGSEDIARLSIEQALAASHRHVFAVLLWFVLLPGPCGAVLYRLAAVIDERWAGRNAVEPGDFFTFSRLVFGMIDWLPLRVTAFAFAIVGDFEDAIHCWRTQAGLWPDRDLGIVLSSGAGALGVQLGMPVLDGSEVTDRAALGTGDAADADFMQSAVGLVWRATVLWMLLLFLLGLATLAG
jgi:cobalamin biosynthesis protein CobD/CbiB